MSHTSILHPSSSRSYNSQTYGAHSLTSNLMCFRAHLNACCRICVCVRSVCLAICLHTFCLAWVVTVLWYNLPVCSPWSAVGSVGPWHHVDMCFAECHPATCWISVVIFLQYVDVCITQPLTTSMWYFFLRYVYVGITLPSAGSVWSPCPPPPPCRICAGTTPVTRWAWQTWVPSALRSGAVP